MLDMIIKWDNFKVNFTSAYKNEKVIMDNVGPREKLCNSYKKKI